METFPTSPPGKKFRSKEVLDASTSSFRPHSNPPLSYADLSKNPFPDHLVHRDTAFMILRHATKPRAHSNSAREQAFNYTTSEWRQLFESDLVLSLNANMIPDSMGGLDF